jgi:hypothetical protein
VDLGGDGRMEQDKLRIDPEERGSENIGVRSDNRVSSGSGRRSLPSILRGVCRCPATSLLTHP